MQGSLYFPKCSKFFTLRHVGPCPCGWRGLRAGGLQGLQMGELPVQARPGAEADGALEGSQHHHTWCVPTRHITHAHSHHTQVHTATCVSTHTHTFTHSTCKCTDTWCTYTSCILHVCCMHTHPHTSQCACVCTTTQPGRIMYYVYIHDTCHT